VLDIYAEWRILVVETGTNGEQVVNEMERIQMAAAVAAAAVAWAEWKAEVAAQWEAWTASWPATWVCV